MNGKGFTLIEVAAAVVILALIVVPLLGARNRTIASAVEASRKAAATQLAASKMSELAAKPLAEIDRSGSFEDLPECAWEFSVEPELVELELVEPEAEEAVSLYRVTLRVCYGLPSAGRSRGEIVVSTLVIEKEQE